MEPSKISKLALLILLFSGFTVTVAYPQQGQVMERIREERIAFFTQKLDLSTEEAQNFWPVYNDYTDRKEKINHEMQRLRFSVSRNAETLNDEEIEKSLENYVELEGEQHKLFIEFHDKFLEILPPRKVMMLYITENQFKQYLLRKLRDRAGQQGPGGRR